VSRSVYIVAACVITIIIVASIGYIALSSSITRAAPLSSGSCYKIVLGETNSSILKILLKKTSNCVASPDTIPGNTSLKVIKIKKIVAISRSGGRIGCSINVDIPLINGTLIPPCVPKYPGLYYPCIVLSNGAKICAKNVTIVAQP